MKKLFIDIIAGGLIGKFDDAWTEPIRITAFVLSVILIILSSYLLGSLNFAIIISHKKYKQDIREFGSNNAGMTNMMRTYGNKAAAWTLIGDALKAAVSCIIAYLLIGRFGAFIAGLFCVLGHVFPIFYKFKGGKGVVTAGVAILMCNPLVFLVLITVFVILVAAFRYISLGSVMSVLLYPIVLDRLDRIIFKTEGSIGTVFAVLITILIVYKHWENIKRLFQGKENKFSFKKSVKSAPETSDKDENKTEN